MHVRVVRWCAFEDSELVRVWVREGTLMRVWPCRLGCGCVHV